MSWTVANHDDFDPEFDGLPEAVQDALNSVALILQDKGPVLGRPYVDTLEGSKYLNMKEMRFDGDNGVWRVASRSIPNGRRFCWSLATRQAWLRSGSTRS